MLNTTTTPSTNFWARDKKTKRWYRVQEGTGDNLSQEDVDNGYVDYIYYDVYKTLNDVKDEEIFDGGMYYLKKLYQNMTVEEIIKCLNEFEMVDLEVIELDE